MTHTQNYNLTQWDAADRILRSDFNADNAAIDAALAAHAVQLAKLGNCGIEVYTYTGTGTYGTGNPTVIPFSRMPTFFILSGHFILVMGLGGAERATAIIRPLNGNGANLSGPPLEWDGPTLRFTNSTTMTQANESGQKYFAIAFYAEDAEA